jgi:aspartate/methionine/tyrosine aminotransferase
VGAAQVAQDVGADPDRVIIFHSLSKRSNLPGLRSGFVASGASAIREMQQLRNFAGAPLPLPLQHAAAAVWNDEAHVIENRRLYIEKYDIADRILGNVPGYQSPQAGFFLWLPVADDETAARKLWQDTGVRVLPGGYLAQDVNGVNPGKGYIRAAMVAPKAEMERGIELIRDCLYPQ